MSYRIETASSGRAVCRATECKKHQVKIDKGELRMGTWVEYEETGSWHWKHWGCVSGFQLQQMRNNLEDPEHPGTYRWDFLDGYEGEEKNSLDKHPELQEKVRRVIVQGFIDPEDFNGDPEMNRLGEKGLYTAESKKKMRRDQIERNQEIEALQAQVAALSAERVGSSENGESSQKTKVKAEAGNNDPKKARTKGKSANKNALKEEAPSQKTNKRKRVSKSVKDEEDEEAYDAKPTKRSRDNKVKKEEEVDTVKEESDDAPLVTSVPKKGAGRGKRTVKDESQDGETSEAFEAKPKRQAKKAKGKPAVKQEVPDNEESINQVSEYQEAKPTDHPKKRKGKAIKQEKPEASSATLAGDAPTIIQSPGARSGSAGESYIPGIKDSDLQYDFDMAVDAGDIEDDFEAYIEKRKEDSQPKKRGRSKKPAGSKGASSRSKRTTTK